MCPYKKQTLWLAGLLVGVPGFIFIFCSKPVPRPAEFYPPEEVAAPGLTIESHRTLEKLVCSGIPEVSCKALLGVKGRIVEAGSSGVKITAHSDWPNHASMWWYPPEIFRD